MGRPDRTRTGHDREKTCDLGHSSRATRQNGWLAGLLVPSSDSPPSLFKALLRTLASLSFPLWPGAAQLSAECETRREFPFPASQACSGGPVLKPSSSHRPEAHGDGASKVAAPPSMAGPGCLLLQSDSLDGQVSDAQNTVSSSASFNKQKARLP